MNTHEDIALRPWIFATEVVLSAALIAPLIVLEQSAVFPFIFPKAIFIELMTVAAVVCSAPLFFRSPEFRMRRNSFFVVVGLYTIALIASSIFALNPSRAFWSNFERMTGSVFIMHTMVLGYITARYFQARKERIMPYLFFATGVAAVASVLGITQRFLPGFLLSTGIRVSGTFGNAIYLGNYAALFTIIGVYLLFRVRHVVARSVLVACVLLNITAVYLSETRGAMVALVIAGLLFLFIHSVRMWRAERRPGAFIIFLCAIVLCGGIYGIAQTSLVPSSSALKRLTTLSLTSDTGSTRVIAWEIALKGWRERPLLGWGPENFYYVFDKFFDPRSLTFGSYETWFDHAHDAPLDVLVTQGSIGFVLYLAQYIALLWLCFETARNTHDRRMEYLLSVALGLFFVAHFLQNLTVFDHPASYMIFYVMAGIVVARWGAFAKHTTEQTNMPSHATIASPSSRLVRERVIQCASVIAALLIVVPAVRENYLDLQAQLIARRSVPLARNFFESARAINGPFREDVLTDMGRTAYNVVGVPQNPDQLNTYQFGIQGLDEAIAFDPYHLIAVLLKAQMLTNMVAIGNTSVAPAAEDAFAHAQALSPERQQIYYSWAKLRLVQNDIAGGKKLLQHAIDLEPSVGQSYWYMAALLADAEPDTSYTNLEVARSHGFDVTDAQNRFVAARIYQKTGHNAQAEDLYLLSVREGGAGIPWSADLVHEVDGLAQKDHNNDLQEALRSAFGAVFATDTAPQVQKK